MDTPSLISVAGLDHFYGTGKLKRQILTDINTDIRAGEIVILTGPSGSGENNLAHPDGGAAFGPERQPENS